MLIARRYGNASHAPSRESAARSVAGTRPAFALRGGGNLEGDGRDDDLRRLLRPRRKAADRAAEDGRREPLPADLDRAPRGGRDPDEAAGSDRAAAADARPADEHPR